MVKVNNLDNFINTIKEQLKREYGTVLTDSAILNIIYSQSKTIAKGFNRKEKIKLDNFGSFNIIDKFKDDGIIDSE